jgi:hypothetical protein
MVDNVIGASDRERGGTRDPRGMTGVQASVVNPLVRLAFRLRIPDHAVINKPALALLAEQYAPPERHRDPDVSPREFLDLRDRISAGADARRATAVFVDRMLRG